eukprot:5242448-Alexandrium_andersonii.AAC.1
MIAERPQCAREPQQDVRETEVPATLQSRAVPTQKKLSQLQSAKVVAARRARADVADQHHAW